MRPARSFVDATLNVGGEVELDERATAHLVRVLRRRAGDECIVFNGDGHEYRARLRSATKRGAVAEVLERRPVDRESPLHITLVQALARGEKMDWILQKATELGVSAIAPVVAGRGGVHLDGERLQRRLAHWRGVLVAACEQCGRTRVPELVAPRALAAHVADTVALTDTQRLMLEAAAGTGVSALPQARRFELLVGPEGGFCEAERALLAGAGYRGLSLGPRVLRTETAGAAAIAALQTRFGDFT